MKKKAAIFPAPRPEVIRSRYKDFLAKQSEILKRSQMALQEKLQRGGSVKAVKEDKTV